MKMCYGELLYLTEHYDGIIHLQDCHLCLYISCAILAFSSSLKIAFAYDFGSL